MKLQKMSETKTYHITTQRTARYFTLGELNTGTKDVWIVLHGYGQLAEYFIRHFKNIQNSHNFIVAPEALSRYYVNENTGRVGASWMTKDDREHEINDYLVYLEKILDNLAIEKSCNIHILGFSQGAATASRFAMHSKHKIHSLICWAGFFPPDMQWDSAQYMNEEMKAYVLIGNEDSYINEEQKIQMQKIIKSLVKQPELIIFEGKHEIIASTLSTLAQRIEK